MTGFDSNHNRWSIHQTTKKQFVIEKWRKEEYGDNDRLIIEPTVLHDSGRLIQKHLKIQPQDFAQILQDKYNVYFPNEILAEILNISKFRGNTHNLEENVVNWRNI